MMIVTRSATWRAMKRTARGAARQGVVKKTGAYFTVEAALVFPFVLGVVLLVIYLLFFQYNRCLMEQSAGTLALRGCTLQRRDNKELVAAVLAQAEEEDRPYLAWEPETPQITAKGNQFRVQREGQLTFPFHRLIFVGGEDRWACRATYQNRRIHPVAFIRTYQKWTGGT